MKRATDVPRMSREKVLTAANVSNAAARFIVSDYYRTQELRKRADLQLRHLGEGAATELVHHLEYIGTTHAVMESQIQRQLEVYAKNNPIGRWMLAQLGVGPVISAGFLAFLDITKAPTAGSFWRFADIDPTVEWNKGEKRPYCAEVKQLCYHLGECVKRVSGKDSLYGNLYKSRKKLLVQKNESGVFAERAKIYKTKSDDVVKTLATGKLPDSNIDRQACNHVAKIFLSHLHGLMFWDHFKKPPPKPFSIAIMGHAHEIHIPDTDMFPGFAEAYYGEQSSQAAE